MKSEKIVVTSPLLPPLEEYITCLEEIWQSKQIANCGVFHNKLEQELQSYLKVSNVSLFTNGTLALICAFKELGIEGEVITTPYSFIATTNVLQWCGIKPVFVDIDPVTCNIDPEKIEAAITPNTKAILPVHIYGNPCETNRIQALANQYKLKVVYDAAHAFGVEVNGKSVLDEGDMSIVSFHATKTFNTVEGGALIYSDNNMKKQVDSLKNFGFDDKSTIAISGINAKMDELRSAYGLVSLPYVDQAIKARQKVARFYREKLRNISGISFIDDLPNVKHNYTFFPIFIDPDKCGFSRDELDLRMKKDNIFCRKYFSPLISDCIIYKNESSAFPGNLPVAFKKSESVLCLPIHHKLSKIDVDRILSHIII